VESVQRRTAQVTGELISSGGSEVTAAGICFSTEPVPTIDDRVSYTSTEIGVFTAELSGLKPKEFYYARAFAINITGVAYGDTVTFETPLTYGDLDADGDIDLADAILVLKILTDLDKSSMIYWDVALVDEQIGFMDLFFILQKIALIR
jgi:hypothetical protein